MGRIRVLPETVQNKIAAGEVIERPASVVKELAENSLDAGASLVEIELEDGGHRCIRVSDNGCGMDEADLVASLQRHATSKIAEVDDIFRIATFGFRGEALPSIGSVSRMTIATGTDGESEGRELIIEGGTLVRLSPAAHRRGTRIEVRDIFYNTPARRKFLKQPASEGTRTAEIVTRLALGNPKVGFRYQNGDRIVLAVRPADSQQKRIADIFGNQMGERLVPFSGDLAEGLSVSGFFARPPYCQKTSKDIYVLVNRRWIRYYGLTKAVSDAFEGIITSHQHPFAVVNLEVDPARVDVNVHPTKEEVRFEQERILVGGVRRAIRAALAGVAAVPTVSGFMSGNGLRPATPPDASPSAPPARDRQSRLDLPSHFGARPASDLSSADFSAVRDQLRSGGGQAHEPEHILPDTPQPSSPPDHIPPVEPLPVHQSGLFRVVGQVDSKYIVVESPEGIIYVDPHALHERWNYDRLRAARQRGAAGQRLLVPVELELAPAEAAAAEEAVPALAEYGFDLVLPAPNRLRVVAAPTFLPAGKLEHLLRQVLADVGEAGATLEAAREKLLASLACRSSVLLGHALPREEMLALLDTFFHQGQLPTCPHGRPTAIRVSWEELARRFGR